MYYPSYELCEEYQRQRLHEAEKARLLRRLQQGKNSAFRTKLFTKVVVSLGDLLVRGGLKLKRVAQHEVPSW